MKAKKIFSIQLEENDRLLHFYDDGTYNGNSPLWDNGQYSKWKIEGNIFYYSHPLSYSNWHHDRNSTSCRQIIRAYVDYYADKALLDDQGTVDSTMDGVDCE